MEKMCQPIEVLTHGLIKQLKLKFYGKETLNNYQRILTKLAQYMQQNKIPAYTSEIGSVSRITFPIMK